MATNKIQEIHRELQKLKAFRKSTTQKLTAETLKLYKGFEGMSLEKRQQVVETLKEYARIVLTQLNRLVKIKQNKNG